MPEQRPQPLDVYEYLRSHFEILPNSVAAGQLKAFGDHIKRSHYFRWMGLTRAVNADNTGVVIQFNFVTERSTATGTSDYQRMVELFDRWTASSHTLGVIRRSMLPSEVEERKAGAYSVSQMEKSGLTNCKLLFETTLR